MAIFLTFLDFPESEARVFKKFYEGVDYRASAQVGYPWFGILDGHLGYGYIFWGQKITPPTKFKDVKYGYFRPHVRYLTAGIINRLEARMDVYPISFFGITFGQIFSHSAIHLLGDSSQKTGLDCNSIQCGGLLFRSFLEAKLKGGYDDYFGVLFWRWDFLVNSGSKSKGFADFSSSLTGGGRSDILVTQWIKLARKLPKNWAVGIHLQHNHMTQTRQHAYEEQIFGNFSFLPDWSLGLGLKAMQTPTRKFEMGVGFQLNWNGKTSVEL